MWPKATGQGMARQSTHTMQQYGTGKVILLKHVERDGGFGKRPWAEFSDAMV